MELLACHDSHKLFFRNPFGAVPCTQTIIFRIVVFSKAPVEECTLRVWENQHERLIPMKLILDSTDSDSDEPLKNSGEVQYDSDHKGQKVIFEIKYEAPGKPGIVWYYFKISTGEMVFYYGNNPRRVGGIGKLEEKEPPSFQVTVYSPMEIAKWFRQGIIYQVYVDRFFQDREKEFALYPRRHTLLHANWNDTPVYIKDEAGRVTDWDFFGGNLAGVRKKLPYLRELGVSILYFNPIFESPSNHKYDTADYKRIDPMYGDEDLFGELVREARRLGIAIILDGVFSHTGSDSVYFNIYGRYPGLGAYQSADSPYFQWYQFKAKTQEYKCWWDVDDLPEVNELEPSYLDFLLNPVDGVIQKWMKKGIAGWRLDVADELPDEFIKKFRETMKTLNPESVLIGEVWEDASNKQSYGKQREYFWGDELDAAMNYPFREIFLNFLLGLSESALVHEQIMSLFENYPPENFYAAMNLIGSHDRARILTVLGEAPPEPGLSESQKRFYRLLPESRELAVRRLKLFSLIQMTFPGVPCIYYGDEAGMEGYSDPYNRGTYPWGQEDQEILDWYKKVIRLRLEYEVLETGDFQSFCIEPDVYGFKRTGESEGITVLINRHRNETKELCLNPEWLDNTNSNSCLQGIDLLSGKIINDMLQLNRKGSINRMDSAIRMNPLSALAVFYKHRQFAFPMHSFTRSCGVLMHITSLPSDFGTGDLGEAAYRFIDFLVESGHPVWQVLPLNPVGLGNSPYQSDSAFAGNANLISLEELSREGLIQVNLFKTFSETIDSAEKVKEACLREAFKTFRSVIRDSGSNNHRPLSEYLSEKNYLKFKNDHRDWLNDYALYRALKVYFAGIPWYEWEPDIANRKAEKLEEYFKLLEDEVEFYCFMQYTFFCQWSKLRAYAQAKNVKLVGDIPLYVAGDSCDVWMNRKFFKLDESGKPAKVAGVPPDYFSQTGQLWGNPVYDWDTLAKHGYSWWKLRIKHILGLFDFVRLDHFRGFEAYWEVDASEETAVNGRWLKGPGKRFFESLAAETGDLPFIAEDLGIITAEVNTLKRIFGFPGMKVLQFTPLEEALDEDNNHVVYYSGTHDNDTLMGWYKSSLLPEEENNFNRLPECKQPEAACKGLLEAVYQSPVTWVITPMQDLLGLDTEARMNVPGTIEGNWQWKLTKEMLTTDLKNWLKVLARESGR